ncbi:hypothetical protein ACU4GD_20000 [Cupriavidus basilensis]
MAVNRLLGDTLDAATEDDVVFLSFAGHGTPDHRLVLADTQMADLPGTTLGMDSLAVRFKASRARAVVLLLDCCFSGGAPARVLDAGVVARGMTLPLRSWRDGGVCCSPRLLPIRAALEDPQTRHGLFTKAIVDYLFVRGRSGECGSAGRRSRSQGACGCRPSRLTAGPVMFGLVEEELTSPAGRRGPRYLECFPERGLASTSGNFGDLASFALPQQAIAAWQARFPTGLNALQIAAINKHRVLDGSSLTVVCADQRGEDIHWRTGGHEVRCPKGARRCSYCLTRRSSMKSSRIFPRCTGRNWAFAWCGVAAIGRIRSGTSCGASTTSRSSAYEKFLSMSLAAPSLMHQLGLVVLDEAQFITEPGRGMVVELLLTNPVSLRQRGVSPQLLTLSAVIGDMNWIRPLARLLAAAYSGAPGAADRRCIGPLWCLEVCCAAEGASEKWPS